MYHFLPPTLILLRSIDQAACLSQFQPIGGHMSAGQLVIGQTDCGQTEADKRSYKASLSSIFPSLKTLYSSIRQMEHHHWSTSMLICTSLNEHAVRVCVFESVSPGVYIYIYICVCVFPGVKRISRCEWVQLCLRASISVCVSMNKRRQYSWHRE